MSIKASKILRCQYQNLNSLKAYLSNQPLSKDIDPRAVIKMNSTKIYQLAKNLKVKTISWFLLTLIMTGPLVICDSHKFLNPRIKFKSNQSRIQECWSLMDLAPSSNQSRMNLNHWVLIIITQEQENKWVNWTFTLTGNMSQFKSRSTKKLTLFKPIITDSTSKT